MIAYKGTKNFRCGNMQYQVGKTYTFKGSPKSVHKYGFHVCKNIADVDQYYPFGDSDTVVLEVEIPDNALVIKDKESEFSVLVTNKLKVLRILTKKDIEKVANGKVKFDKNGNLTYIEYTNGWWTKFEYSENNVLAYKETFNGKKYKFDENGNEIYFEFGDYWEKLEYDDNGRLVLHEDSTGTKRVWKYDGRQVYFENYLNGKRTFWKRIIYDQQNRIIFEETSDGFIYAHEHYKNESWEYSEYQDEITIKCTVYDNNGRVVRSKNGNHAVELKYDNRGNLVFYRETTERWFKRKFDENNNMIEYKHSSGFHEWYKYDDNGNCVYYKNTDGVEYEIVIE